MIYNSSNFHHNSEKRLNVSLFETLSLFFPYCKYNYHSIYFLEDFNYILLFIKSKSANFGKLNII